MRTQQRFGQQLSQLIFVLLPGFVLTCLGQSAPGFYPRGTNVQSLWVLPQANFGSAAEQVMVATLQGIVARQSSEQIYLDGGSGYSIWKNDLHTNYGVALTTVNSPWAILRHFRQQIDGYVLYDATRFPDSLSAANSLAGKMHGIAVDASIESQVRASGVTNRLYDARAMTALTVWSNDFRGTPIPLVVEQRATISANLRDYASMAGAFVFFDGNSPFRSQVMAGMAGDGACIGWGDASQGENVFVSDGSKHGVHTVAADWALNLSTLSSVREENLSQAPAPPSVGETNIHQVAFLVTDGDNVQWTLGGFPGYFNQPSRGTFDLGWALPPALADLAPSVVRWFYDQSSTGAHRDHFVAGVSGNGYFYPSQYPPEALAIQVNRLGTLLDRTDLDIVQILDFHSFNRIDLWNTYFSQPNLRGLFYLEYAPYNGAQGAIQFSTNGQPIIAARDLFWPGLEEAPALIQHLNSYPRDPSSPDGYSLVPVLVWGETVASIASVVSNLAPQVRVVTPDVLVREVRNRVGRNLTYSFSLGLQGWQGSVSGKPYDKAQWSAAGGFPGGVLLLDGSDLGQSDATPNAWFSRQISLPQNVTDLSFDTKANNDGQLRVRLTDARGNQVTLLNWEKLPQPNVWVHRTTSLRAYAGQTVTLLLEQNDGGKGSGEYRYVDNVQVESSGDPVFRPLSPRILSIGYQQGVQISWRDNDVLETGFRVERRQLGGAWNEIAVVSPNITQYQDISVLPGVGYEYRVRSWNPAGTSDYSQPRSVQVPPRPKLTVSLSGGRVALGWPTSPLASILVSSSTLSDGATWSPVPGGSLFTNGLWTVQVPLEKGASFFQLR